MLKNPNNYTIFWKVQDFNTNGAIIDSMVRICHCFSAIALACGSLLSLLHCQGSVYEYFFLIPILECSRNNAVHVRANLFETESLKLLSTICHWWNVLSSEYKWGHFKNLQKHWWIKQIKMQTLASISTVYYIGDWSQQYLSVHMHLTIIHFPVIITFRQPVLHLKKWSYKTKYRRILTQCKCGRLHIKNVISTKYEYL